MIRLILKFALYYAVLLIFYAIGWLPSAAVLSLLAAVAVLAGVNTLIRPLLVTIALPLNIITFGIASIFANLLSLVIANEIVGGTVSSGFWIMLLIALVIMLLDDTVRNARQHLQKLNN